MWKEIAIFLLGFLTHWFQRAYRNHKRVRNHFGAIGVEADVSIDLAKQFIAHKVIAPSYRFPTMAYQSSFPILLSEGAIQRADAKALTKYFSLVDSINRGLDLVASIPHTENEVLEGDSKRLSRYNTRNISKTNELINNYPETKAVIDRCSKQPFFNIPGILKNRLN